MCYFQLNFSFLLNSKFFWGSKSAFSSYVTKNKRSNREVGKYVTLADSEWQAWGWGKERFIWRFPN